MKKKLFNPFEFIAGTKALVIGVIAILITAILNYYANRPFTIIINWGVARTIIESFAGWILFSLLLYVLGVVFSKSKVRLLDVLGTQALARVPNIISPLITFIPTFKLFLKYELWKTFGKGDPVDMSAFGIVLSLVLYGVLFFSLIWTFVLMFNAFKVSTNIKGEKSAWIFIIALIIGLVVGIGARIFLFAK